MAIRYRGFSVGRSLTCGFIVQLPARPENRCGLKATRSSAESTRQDDSTCPTSRSWNRVCRGFPDGETRIARRDGVCYRSAVRRHERGGKFSRGLGEILSIVREHPSPRA